MSKKDNLPTAPIENRQRRQTVKTIITGVTALAAYNALPVKWSVPIVESICLPAHAATSGTSLHAPCSITLISGSRNSNEVVIRVDGYVIPATANLSTAIVAMPEGTGNLTTANTTTLQDGTFTATMTITGGPSITRINVETTVIGASGSATCAIDVNGATQPTDSDGDGVPDSSDVCEGYNDNDDFDGDGVPDGCDVCEGGDDRFDADRDGIPDDCDRVLIGSHYTNITSTGSLYVSLQGEFGSPPFEIRFDREDTNFVWFALATYTLQFTLEVTYNTFKVGDNFTFTLTHIASGQSETITVIAQDL